MGRAKEENGTAYEMIKFLGPIGKKKLLTVLNEIYETGELLKDMIRYVIMLPKRLKLSNARTLELSV